MVEGYPDERKTDALGRVYVIHGNSECFHLGILLQVVKGPTFSLAYVLFKVYLMKNSKDFVKQSIC